MLDGILIALLAILVILSAFFSGCEIAFGTCNKIKLKKEYEKNPEKAKLAYEISENFPNTISIVLVGNNLVNIAASSIATVIGIHYWGEDIGPTIATIGIACIILTLGEIIPKLYGTAKANKLIYTLAWPLKIFVIIFKPIAYVVTKMINWLAPIWTPKTQEPTVTDDELVSIVDSIEDDGIIDEQKSDLIKSAIKFSDVDAYDIMIPRVDVLAFDIEDDIEDFINEKELLNYAFIPVYEDNLDNILGVISTKQVIKKTLNHEKIDVKSLLQEPLYVHETKAISDILKEMHTSKIHMAVVVDEFGGTDGILTSEDILEELVGDIWDEMDKIEYEYIENPDGTYVIDGDMNLYDMFELLEISDKDLDSEYSTVGGWVTEVLEKFPEVGDTINYKNITVTVLKIDDKRVEKIKVEIHEIIKDEDED